MNTFTKYNYSSDKEMCNKRPMPQKTKNSHGEQKKLKQNQNTFTYPINNNGSYTRKKTYICRLNEMQAIKVMLEIDNTTMSTQLVNT